MLLRSRRSVFVHQHHNAVDSVERLLLWQRGETQHVRDGLPWVLTQHTLESCPDHRCKRPIFFSPFKLELQFSLPYLYPWIDLICSRMRASIQHTITKHR